MTAPSEFKFALACGVAGAYVDVTADVLFEEGDITFVEGRAAEFDDVRPGTFGFTLANGDGKYTPDNLATSLATPFSEGMGVVMQIDDLLLSGTVRDITLIFPPRLSEDEARVRVAVDDMLAQAARVELGSQDQLMSRDVPTLWWPLDDAAGSDSGRFRGTASGSSFVAPSSGVYEFGTQPISGVGTTQLTLTGTSVATATWNSLPPFGIVGVVSSFSCWITLTTWGGAYISSDQPRANSPFIIGIEAASKRSFIQNNAGSRAYGPTVTTGVPYLFTLVPNAPDMDGYINGVYFGSVPLGGTGFGSATSALSLVVTTPGKAQFSQLSNTDLPFDVLAGSTPATRLEAVRSFTRDSIEFDTFPSLDAVPFGAADLDNQSALDAINAVVRSEQGHLWVETGGTLLSPDPLITVGARDRERGVDYSFDVSEILDPINFERSLSNTISQFTATGPDTSATYRDDDLADLVGAASSSDSLLFRDYGNLFAYASDRVSRGVNHGIPIVAFTVDATSPEIDRWSDLTSIRQGHRIQITGLPENQLGYDTWDGFVVGRSIATVQDTNGDPKTFFTFNLSPRLPVALYDTARYSAGGALTLSSSINSSVTSISVATTAEKLTTNVSYFPFDIRIGNEILTVTAATGATPQVLTVTRGVNAAAHSAGAIVDLANVDILDTDRYAL